MSVEKWFFLMWRHVFFLINNLQILILFLSDFNLLFVEMEESEIPKSKKKSPSSGSMSMVAIGNGLDALRLYLYVSSKGLLYEVDKNDVTQI